MPFLPQFDYEIFLSYGWGDNSNPTSGDRAWVTKFKELLEREISDNLPYSVRIYLDVEQSKNGEVPSNLERAIRSSVLFLAVLTENSCRPESWCRWEIEKFHTHALNPLDQDKRQVFSIRIRDVDRSRWPANLNPYDFVYKSGQDLIQYDSSELASGSTPARTLLKKVAVDIRNELKRIHQQIEKTDLIAETSANLARTVATLKQEANFNGRSVLGATALSGRSEQDAELDLAHLLRWSSRSIHVVNEEFDLPIQGSELSIQAIQLRLAHARFEAERQAIIVWKEPDATSPSLNMISKIAPYATIQENRPLHETQPFLISAKPDTQASPTSGTRYVFVQCSEQDRSVIKQLRSYFPNQVFLRPPNFDGPKPGRSRMNRELAERCHGVAVYYGDRKEYDTWNACNNITAALGERTRLVPRVVLLRPASEDRLDFFHPDFERIPWDDQSPPTEQLSAFLEQVLRVPL